MTFFWGFVVGREQFASVALSAAALKAASQIRLFFSILKKTEFARPTQDGEANSNPQEPNAEQRRAKPVIPQNTSGP